MPLLDGNPTLSSRQSSGQTSTVSSVKDPAEGSTTSSNQAVVEQVTEMEPSRIVTDVLDSLRRPSDQVSFYVIMRLSYYV